MKKLLIGCAVVVLLVVALLVGAGIYASVKIQKIQTNLKTSADAVGELETKYPFTPPDKVEDPWDTSRVESYFAVRKQMFDLFDSNQTLKKIDQQKKTGKRADVGVGEMMSLMTKFPVQVMDTFHDQLETHHMAPTEYFYWTRAVYTTIKEGADKDNAEMSELYEEVRSGQDIANKTVREYNTSGSNIQIDAEYAEVPASDEEIAPANIAVIKAHEEEIKRAPEFMFYELMMAKMLEDYQKQKAAGGASGKPATSGGQ